MSKDGATITGVWHGDTIIVDMATAQTKGFERSASRIAARAEAGINLGPGDPEHLRDTVRVRRGSKAKNKGDVFVIAGARQKGVFWHFMVEFGTYFKKANPFMRPAVDANFNSTLAEAARAGKREINKKRRITSKTKRINAGMKR